jgi:hypothetical protein
MKVCGQNTFSAATKESVRKRFENVHFTTDPARKGHVPVSVLGEIKPTRKAIEFSRAIWKTKGYHEKH